MYRLIYTCLVLVLLGSAGLIAQPVFRYQPINLILENYRGDLQWQRSSDADSWEDVEGATRSPFTVTPDADTYFRAVVTDESCDAIVSPVQFVDVLEGVVPGPTTILLRNTTLATLREVTPDNAGLTFVGPNAQLDSIVTDDIIILGITPLTPYGLLRRVTDVRRSGNTYLITTVQAALTEAFEELSVSLSQTITPADVDTIILSEGVELLPAANFRAAAVPFRVAYEKTENGLTLEGEVELSPSLDFSLDIDFFTVQNLFFKASLMQKSKIMVGATGTASADTDFDLFTLRLTPIVAGPLIIFPQINFEANLEGEVTASISAFVEDQSAAFTIGAEYSDGQWRNLSEPTAPSFTGEFLQPGGNAVVNASIGPEVEYSIYGIIGVEIESFEVYGGGRGRDIPARFLQLKPGGRCPGYPERRNHHFWA